MARFFGEVYLGKELSEEEKKELNEFCEMRHEDGPLKHIGPWCAWSLNEEYDCLTVLRDEPSCVVNWMHAILDRFAEKQGWEAEGGFAVHEGDGQPGSIIQMGRVFHNHLVTQEMEYGWGGH